MSSYPSRNKLSFQASSQWTATAKGLAHVVLMAFLTSCATDPVHQLALKKAKEGPVDEGVAGLKKSTIDQPDNIPYRADYLRERERVLNQFLLDAARAYGKGDLTEAESIYQRALSIEPSNSQAQLGLAELERSRQHADAISRAREALEHADYESARLALQPVLLEDPKNSEALRLNTEIDNARFNGRMTNPLPELRATFKKPVSMQFRDASLKMVLEALSKSSGLNVLVDKEIKNDLKATIFVKDASVEDVLSLILMQNQLEKKVINDTTVYIYPNTPAKVKEFQDLVVRTFQLNNADAKQMVTMLKTLLKANDVFVNEKTNSIVMRDTPDVVELAGKMLAAQDQNEPEVMLEVEVVELSHSKALQLGAKYPTQFAFAADAATLRDLKNINDAKIKVGVGKDEIMGIAFDLKSNDADTNILASPRIRVKQNEKAKIHVGDRVPTFSSTVAPGTAGANTNLVAGSAQYIDVGLKLEVEPQIHIDGEVSIKTNLEVSDIVGQTLTGPNGATAYQVGTRNASTVLRLKDGETQILAGLMRDRDTNSADKVPFLGDIPLIGRLFSTHGSAKEKREIILAITPHIVRNQQQPDASLSSYWSGTGNTVRSRPITAEKMESIKMEAVGGTVLTAPLPPPVNVPPPVPPTGVPLSDSATGSALPAAVAKPEAAVPVTVPPMPPARPQPGVVAAPVARPVSPPGVGTVLPNPRGVPAPATNSGMSGATVGQ